MQEYKNYLNRSELDNLYGFDTYNQYPSAPHKEITNKQLQFLFILNLIVSILVITISINEVVITHECVICSHNGREATYWLAVLGLLFGLISFIFNFFALILRLGFSQIK
jgi:hypothetical protein